MRNRRIEKQLPCKITLSVIVDYDAKGNPIKQKLIDVYAKATEVRNASDTMLIYTEYRELITGRIVARSIPDHKYLEFPDFQRYATYTGKLDKTYQTLKVGDIDVEFDKGYGLSGLLEYDLDPNDNLNRLLIGTLGAYYEEMQRDIVSYKEKYDEKNLADYLDKLDYTAMQRAFPLNRIDSSKPLSFYNKEEYVFIDGDDLLILKYRDIPIDPDLGFGTLLYNYYYEVVTGRKFAIECGTDNHMDKRQTFHFDRDFNREVLASRVLSEDTIKAYKKEKPKVISKRIDDVLKRQYARDQERIRNKRKAI